MVKIVMLMMMMYVIVTSSVVFADDTEKPLPEEVFATQLTGDQLFQAGILYRDNGDFATAKAFLFEAIARGKDDAMVELAVLYLADKLPLESGQDHNTEGVKWLNLAVERKNARANYYWGLIYAGSYIPGIDNDTFVVSEDVAPRDMDKAIECFKKAIELGDHKAYRQIGNLYAEGAHGMEHDFAKAAEYYKQGSELGDFTCSHLYADLLYAGKGVEQNVPEAMKLYQWLVDVKAHNHRDYAWGAYMLGKIYREGQYVAKDEDKALEYFQLAASLGSEDAKAALEASE